MTANTYGRQVVIPLTNKSGGSVAAGDVVIVDTANNDAFTTTTSAGSTATIGVVQETIASNAVGRVLLSGYAALVNVNASVTRGDYGKTHTVAKQATDAGASRGAGTFCQFLTGGTTPDAAVYASDLGSGSGTGTLTTVKDEGSNLSTAVVSVDFVGAGVTATGTTAVTVTIPGGLIRSTLGTTSVGASFDTRGMKIKKITLASAGLLASINAHMKGNGTNELSICAVVYSDSGGNPTNLLYVGPITTSTPTRVNVAKLNTTARWLTFPIGVWLAAADYWIGVFFTDGTGSANSLAYASGTGSDRTVGGGVVDTPVDSSIQAISTGTNDYSIYADVLR